jgi:hypothetical protein
MLRSACIPILGLVLVWGCSGLSAGSAEYPAARDRNLRDIDDPAGKRYEKAICDCVRRDYANALNRCISTLADPDLASFEMILVVEADGRLEQVCLSRETEVAECLRDALLEGSFPEPPRAPFHAHVSMNLR